MDKLMLNYNDFDQIIKNQIDNIDVSLNETKAYIYGVFTNYLNSNNDLSNKSITLEYIKAKEEFNFEKFQTLADWVFFIRSFYPESITASPTLYDTIAKTSYYKCYIILNRKWPCFEELADKFNYFVENIKPLSQSTEF